MLSSILKIADVKFKEETYYRFDILLYILNRIIEVTVYIFVWQSIYKAKDTIAGMRIQEVITYYILSISINSIILWGINEDIGKAIRKGQLSRQLLTPISFIKYYFGVKLGDVASALICSIGTFTICSFIWGLVLPINLLNLILFIMVIALSIVITYFIDVIVGTVAFYTNAIWGMQIFRKAIITIFSGIIAPLVLFPQWFQKISSLLPFKDMVYTPINIYLGKFSLNEIIYVFLRQSIWIIILYFLSTMFFKKAIKHITINGG